jgi:anti-sigma regulatory factor (Ser/Thr protein kinase)
MNVSSEQSKAGLFPSICAEHVSTIGTPARSKLADQAQAAPICHNRKYGIRRRAIDGKLHKLGVTVQQNLLYPSTEPSQTKAFGCRRADGANSVAASPAGAGARAHGRCVSSARLTAASGPGWVGFRIVPDELGATMQWTREFPSRPESIARARHFLGEVVQDICSPVDCDACLLMLSELATNAIRHTHGTSFRVRVAQRADALFVGVSDEDAARPVLRRARGDEGGGLGLPVIERLADQWGVTAERQGKCVWFRVRFG